MRTERSTFLLAVLLCLKETENRRLAMQTMQGIYTRLAEERRKIEAERAELEKVRTEQDQAERHAKHKEPLIQ